MAPQRQPRSGAAAAGLARTFQNIRLFDRLTALENVVVAAQGTGRSRTEAEGIAMAELARMGLASSIVLDGQWSVDTTGDALRASASLRHASGDLRILAGDATAVTAVQSSGQGTGAGKANSGVSLMPACRIAVTRPTLVFSHANGFPAGTYRQLFAIWRAAGWRVLAVEQFGHDPAYPVTSNWPRLRDQLVDFIDAEAPQGAYLVGHSLGGLLSLLAASRRPDLAHGLVDCTAHAEPCPMNPTMSRADTMTASQRALFTATP